MAGEPLGPHEGGERDEEYDVEARKERFLPSEKIRGKEDGEIEEVQKGELIGDKEKEDEHQKGYEQNKDELEVADNDVPETRNRCPVEGCFQVYPR